MKMSQKALTLETETKSADPVECLGETFANDEARREHYLKLLAQKLKDPEFREIEGFPIGKDEDILALSDPPYYTACPNPWIEDFIKHYGTRYDPKKPYHREPFAADVSEGKNHPIYNAHSYHTKVPHRAIMRYILHYTEPGEIVFDGFCGTGMTGVAAQLCGDRVEVEALGYRVQDDGNILNDEGKPFSRLGKRYTFLNDLSPAATSVAYNYNSPFDPNSFDQEAKRLLHEVDSECGWAFTTLYNATREEVELATEALLKCKTIEECRRLLSSRESLCERLRAPNSNLKVFRTEYAIWSDAFSCNECGEEVVFWDAAVDKSERKVSDNFSCPHCSAVLTKRSLERAFVTRFDNALNITVKQAQQKVVWIRAYAGKTSIDKVPDRFDLALQEKLASLEVEAWFPKDRMPDGEESRRNDPAGLTHIHHFYSKRNLLVMASWIARASGSGFRNLLLATLKSSTSYSTRFVKVNIPRLLETGGVFSFGAVTGTLYVPSINAERSLLEAIPGKIKAIKRASFQGNHRFSITTQHSGAIVQCPSGVLDYIFVDPPFGGNLMYSELNFLWEPWQRVLTNNSSEAITNSVQKKGLPEYYHLMAACFSEFYRLLKPGRWLTVEFSNTQASVWNSIQTALQGAGFVVSNVAALDKERGSFKTFTTPTAVKQDLIISAYKPNGGLERRFAMSGETEEGAWDFIRAHLKNLPVVKAKGGQLEFIAERDPRVLYDRMVAFYIGHSTLVPLSSGEFQAGLAEKLPERDGMYFLPEQVNEYDKKRAHIENIGQLSIFVEDERSAINWIRNFLKERPSIYSDIQPDFMQQLGASWKKWEARPELSALLDQNFLSYDGTGEVPSQVHSYLSTQFKELRNLEKDNPQLKAKAKNRWYVPDPKKNVDVETLRNKRLLEEFWSYLPDGYTPPVLSANKGQTLPGIAVARPRIPKGKKLKELRTEAVRVGFKHCYQQKDYQTILVVAEMIPDSVLNEDEQLQMIYDTAVTRSGSE